MEGRAVVMIEKSSAAKNNVNWIDTKHQSVDKTTVSELATIRTNNMPKVIDVRKPEGVMVLGERWKTHFGRSGRLAWSYTHNQSGGVVWGFGTQKANPA